MIALTFTQQKSVLNMSEHQEEHHHLSQIKEGHSQPQVIMKTDATGDPIRIDAKNCQLYVSREHVRLEDFKEHIYDSSSSRASIKLFTKTAKTIAK